MWALLNPVVPLKFATIIKNTDPPAFHSNISFCTLSELRTSFSLTHLSQKSSGYLLRPVNSSERRPGPPRSRSRRWSLTRATHSKEIRLQLRPRFEAAVVDLVGAVEAQVTALAHPWDWDSRRDIPVGRRVSDERVSNVDAQRRCKEGKRGILRSWQVVCGRGKDHRPRP